MSDLNNLRQEGFILAQGFRGFTLWLLGPWAWADIMVGRICGRGASLPHVDRKQREKQKGSWNKIQPPRTYIPHPPSPSDLLSLARSYLLKFPGPPTIVPRAGDQVFDTWAGGDISYSNHNFPSLSSNDCECTSPSPICSFIHPFICPQIFTEHLSMTRLCTGENTRFRVRG
jgi:hypothetical protein